MSNLAPLSGLRFDSEDGQGPRGGDRKLLRRLGIGVVLALVLLYAAGYAFASDRLPRGTTIAGVDVSSQRPASAERELRNELSDVQDAPLEVVVGDQEFSLDPEEVGLDVDIPASVRQVPVGRSWRPADMWESVVGGKDYDAVVLTVDDLLSDRLEEIAGEVGDPAVDGAVTFEPSGPRPTYGESGTELDIDAAVTAVQAAYLGGEAVELELQPSRPEISSADVSRAMNRFANRAMSGPVTLVLGREELRLEPRDFAGVLSMEPEDGRLVPRADVEVLVELLEPRLRSSSAAPVDATVRIQGGRPVVVPARTGATLDEAELEDAFLDLVSGEGDERRGEVPTTKDQPERTTAEVRELGIREKVSEFTTYYPHADYRNVNIGRAAEIIDGTILEPGETFSLNETVGERTRKNGFTEGFIISDGVFAEDLGGGVSQVATTTFNAAFFAGLEDVEHKPHSFYIDRYPVGREATVAWPTVDLKFRNDTGHGILIQTVHQPSSYAAQGSLTVRMWSTKEWDIEARTGDRYAYTSPETRYLSGDECVPNSGYSGFQVVVTRVFRKHGEPEVDHTERFHTTYTPSDSVVCT